MKKSVKPPEPVVVEHPCAQVSHYGLLGGGPGIDIGEIRFNLDEAKRLKKWLLKAIKYIEHENSRSRSSKK